MNLKAGTLEDHFRAVSLYKAQALSNGWYQPAVLTALGEHVAQVEPAQEYFAHLDTVKADFCDWLLTSTDFHDHLGRWAELDPKTEQKPYLQTCINKLAELMGRAGIPVSAGKMEYYTCHEEHASDAYVGFNTITSERDQDVIAFNLAYPERQQNLLSALQSIVHEQTHLFNLSLNSAFYYRKIESTHALYEEALYFREHYRTGAYIGHMMGKYADPQKNPYLMQLDERAAFRMGDGVLDSLRAKLWEIRQSCAPQTGGIPTASIVH